MADYRRYFVSGGTYFFTVVTERRQTLFDDPCARKILRECIDDTRQRWPFTIVAWVLLPDHMHAIWTLPSDDDKYSLRWSWIKRNFTREWLSLGGREQARSSSRVEQRRRGVWQRRFWEHTIEDETDFENHFDYVHFNPAKHGYVKRPHEWPYSTFHRHVRNGHYPLHWAEGEDLPPLPGNAGE